MDKQAAIRSIHATLRNRGFEEVGPGIADYEGSIKVHGKSVDLRLLIPDVRFAEKPRVYLKDRSQIPIEVLAHVEAETGVCYSSGAGLPVDLYEPGQAILRVLDEVQQTLELSYRGRGLGEVVDEYQQYWYPKLAVKTFLPRVSTQKTVAAQMFFAERENEVLKICIAPKAELRGYRVTHPRMTQVWYVGTKIGPVGAAAAPNTLEQFKVWFDGQQALKDRDWSEIFNWLAQENALFIAAPNALLGLKIKLPDDIAAGVIMGTIRKQKLPDNLRARMASIQVDRLAGTWCAIGDIVSRNNPDRKNLLNVSIALVGCGTIGSHLARMLVQSGAGGKSRFTVFDTEILSEGNIGRHLLGFGDIGKPKADALKAEIERFNPQTEVISYTENAFDHWKVLADHDLVIDATGEWNVQAALNELFLRDDRRPKALLHSWVFMNGAGAQSFLNLRDEFGCFRCLKPEFGGRWRFPAGSEDEELNLQPASCGDGSFVPISDDASVIAASMANRLTLDWASGKPGARLRSQVVDLDRGIYQKPRSPSPASNCPACSFVREAA